MKASPIETYYLHVIAGRSIRELARANKVQDSTISSWISQVQGLRNFEEVSDALTKLEKAPRTSYVTDVWLANAMGTNFGVVDRFLSLHRDILNNPTHKFISGNGVVSLFAGEKPVKTDKLSMPVFHTLLLLRRVIPQWPLYSKVRVYKAVGFKAESHPTDAFEPKVGRHYPRASSPQLTISTRLAQLQKRSHIIKDQDIQTAIALQDWMVNEPKFIEDMSTKLGVTMCEALRRFLVDGEGFESIEKTLGWPARSAKLAFILAFEQARLSLDLRQRMIS